MYYESEYTDEVNLALELIQEEGCEQALVEIGRVLRMGKGRAGTFTLPIVSHVSCSRYSGN